MAGTATQSTLLGSASCSAPSSAPSSTDFAVSIDPSAFGAPTAEAAREAWITESNRCRDDALAGEGWTVVDGAPTEGVVVFEQGPRS